MHAHIFLSFGISNVPTLHLPRSRESMVREPVQNKPSCCRLAAPSAKSITSLLSHHSSPSNLPYPFHSHSFLHTAAPTRILVSYPLTQAGRQLNKPPALPYLVPFSPISVPRPHTIPSYPPCNAPPISEEKFLLHKLHHQVDSPKLEVPAHPQSIDT